MPPRVFPLEIEETIINVLAEDDIDKNHSALKACSLACWAFVPTCRKHIFRSICLNFLTTDPTIDSFARLLVDSPEIADYIREFKYRFKSVDFNCRILQSLKFISKLESLDVSGNWGYLIYPDWSNNPIRSTLLHLLHLPTLTHFSLNAVNDFVISDLIPCVNLKRLELHHLTAGPNSTPFPEVLPSPIQLDEFVFSALGQEVISRLCTTRRPDGQSIVNLKSLSRISLLIEGHEEMVASQMLFAQCERLSHVHITYYYTRDVRPKLSDMLRPSMETLKHIVVRIHSDFDINDPLFDFPSELEDMRTKNILESITIRVIVNCRSCSDGDKWGRLDKVLTQPGWIALKLVSLVIDLSLNHQINDDWLPLALQKSPATQFPRLSSSKLVSFSFKVILVPGL